MILPRHGLGCGSIAALPGWYDLAGCYLGCEKNETGDPTVGTEGSPDRALATLLGSQSDPSQTDHLVAARGLGSAAGRLAHRFAAARSAAALFAAQAIEEGSQTGEALLVAARASARIAARGSFAAARLGGTARGLWRTANRLWRTTARLAAATVRIVAGAHQAIEKFERTGVSQLQAAKNAMAAKAESKSVVAWEDSFNTESLGGSEMITPSLGVVSTMPGARFN